MKKKNIRILSDLSAIILLLSIGFIIGLGVGNKMTEIPTVKNLLKELPDTEEDIIEDCKGLSLEKTSICFKDNIETFYEYDKTYPEYLDGGILASLDKSQSSYILSTDSTNLTLIDYLKENGGKCTEWALLYKRLCEKTDFNCDYIEVSDIEGVVSGHIYTVMFDNEKYCKLDQTIVKCYEREI